MTKIVVNQTKVIKVGTWSEETYIYIYRERAYTYYAYREKGESLLYCIIGSLPIIYRVYLRETAYDRLSLRETAYDIV